VEVGHFKCLRIERKSGLWNDQSPIVLPQLVSAPIVFIVCLPKNPWKEIFAGDVIELWAVSNASIRNSPEVWPATVWILQVETCD
jgi:hypothetical protein